MRATLSAYRWHRCNRSVGPGTRASTIIISPFAKRHFIDHTTYDTTSILKLIETRWALAPLGDRDAHTAGLTYALQLQ